MSGSTVNRTQGLKLIAAAAAGEDSASAWNS